MWRSRKVSAASGGVCPLGNSSTVLPSGSLRASASEDIVDPGLTLTFLQDILRARGPKSVRTACLLSKPSRRQVDVPVDYVGFTIEDRFVIGYGLDYAEKYRNLPYIGVLDE